MVDAVQSTGSWMPPCARTLACTPQTFAATPIGIFTATSLPLSTSVTVTLTRPPFTRGGFGFFPLAASLGREVLAAKLRPGNAGSNTAEDHVEVFCEALEQLPPEALDDDILVRSDSAGANHALADACRETGCRFSFGYSIDERVRAAILGLAKRAWKPAINAGGERREGAWVAELTGLVRSRAGRRARA